MKVIDLLNKIAKGEITELHKFKWDNRIWEEYSKFEEINNDKSYQENRANGITYMRFGSVCDAKRFNDEVETIEEEKEIEKLAKNITDNACATIDQRTIANKINELIDAVNELKKGD